jgi:microcystin-dependent protein
VSIATEVVYVDGTTAVTAAWLNLIQEHLAGWVNLQVTASGQTVTISAAADDSAATVYIGGEMRIIETPITSVFTGAEATATYDVYVVGDSGDNLFAIEVVNGAPVGTNVRKVAEVDYDTTLDEITELRVVRGRFEEHDHTVLSGAQQLAHASLDNLTSGDIHTQYVRVDGSVPFTSVVSGVYPTSSTKLATKKYADDQLTAGVPVGTVVPFGGSAAPSGWLLCDGTSYLNATYPVLAALLADAYGGDGGTNFNVPDMQGVFPFGKPTTGTGSTLGDTGGALDHTHTQPTHTHGETAHTHPMTAHSHTNPAVGSDGAHTHTQSGSGTEANHTHVGNSHGHSAGTLTSNWTPGPTVTARLGFSGSPGLFPEDDLDGGADSDLHSHSGSGTLYHWASTYFNSGSSGSTSFTHTHVPTSNAKTHDHPPGSWSGSVSADGTAATGSAGTHAHNNPTTASSGAHTHTLGSTGTALTVTSANTPGTSSAGGNDATGSENPPFVVVQYIIKADA